MTTADGKNPDVHITYDTNNANELGQLVGSWSELTFERASRLDKRNYTCQAENKAEVRERDVRLYVEYAPKFILNHECRDVYFSWLYLDTYGMSGSQASVAARGYPVRMTCLADGEPMPLITWYLRGLQIKVDNIKYKLIKDGQGYSQLELTPTSTVDLIYKRVDLNSCQINQLF